MVTSVTSLGKNGLYDWVIQRATAVVLGVYFVCLMGFLVLNPDLTFQQWQGYMTSTFMRIFTLIALFSMAAHAWVGLWTITTDYLTTRQLGAMGTALRVAVQGICALVTIVYVVWGIQILWGI
ncbi:succinate dehydrogenase, hydrophobic membrane anchor protein [Ketobacter sp. MCCC 1A13808]|uniref:succinate dehydrogenase, hydrophobic membrane anchor protein n=1 Tax=Ketobacter sp. MCCC 1A13808 TaxID=2602738 RepID=UPI000F280077|nr:succinate dehydrogenase, hydrophobic membrane anchor protein [Ketobacter sp. MCCC 1A13808]MVF12518.1 succinate dehydrogenase, hydrophobic membrane anchor protein [Ketobacter sp. MCCC 1A13808]RLP55678.1 MAG: succinate dehydrogenase, hydrophobic membrane anchor protein [Ketobacter sp.]